MVKREKEDKGTHYTPAENEQRSYFLPKGFGDVFKEFNHGNGSTGARGAFMLFMGCEGFATLRDAAIRATEKFVPEATAPQVKAAAAKIEELVYQEVTTKLVEAIRAPRGMGLSPAMAKLRERLIDEVTRAAYADYAQTLPETERTKFLASRKRT